MEKESFSEETVEFIRVLVKDHPLAAFFLASTLVFGIDIAVKIVTGNPEIVVIIILNSALYAGMSYAQYRASQ